MLRRCLSRLPKPFSREAGEGPGNQWECGESWRRGWESNPRIKVLQTSPLPLGYRAENPWPVVGDQRAKLPPLKDAEEHGKTQKPS